LKDGKAILAILVVQVLSAFFFIGNMLAGLFGLRTQPLKWQTLELLEIGASVGLFLGVILGAIALRKSWQRQKKAEDQLRVASGAFVELLQERFDEWQLTPSEKDVALFAIKGMSTQEISILRSTSEGTVKAQTNAIYRKANVTGRPQLLSLFIDDLMGEALVEQASAPN